MRPKSPGFRRGFYLIGQLPTLPHTRACSTIGAGRLNFRVRDGNGWDPLATITQNLFRELAADEHRSTQIKHLFLIRVHRRSSAANSQSEILTGSHYSVPTVDFMVKPNGLLVTVSSA